MWPLMPTGVTKQSFLIFSSCPCPSKYLCTHSIPFSSNCNPGHTGKVPENPLQLESWALQIKLIRYFKTMAQRDCIQLRVKARGRGRRVNIRFPLFPFTIQIPSHSLLTSQPISNGGKRQTEIRGQKGLIMSRVFQICFSSTQNRVSAFQSMRNLLHAPLSKL